MMISVRVAEQLTESKFDVIVMTDTTRSKFGRFAPVLCLV